jgi:hypothetical protein
MQLLSRILALTWSWKRSVTTNKGIDFVTVHPNHRPHPLSSTRESEIRQVREGLHLVEAGYRLYCFSHGTSSQQGQELLEWLGHLAYPLQEFGPKIVDVDGLYGASLSRAYARLAVAVAVAVGNCQRLEQWLLPLQNGPVLRVAAAPVDEEDEVVDEDENEDERMRCVLDLRVLYFVRTPNVTTLASLNYVNCESTLSALCSRSIIIPSTSPSFKAPPHLQSIVHDRSRSWITSHHRKIRRWVR